MVKSLQKRVKDEDLIDLAYKNKNTIYRRFLMGTIIIGACLLTVLLKLSASKVMNSAIRSIQEHGNTAEAKIENADEEVFSSLSGSLHIKKIGRIHDLGKLIDNEQVYASCVFCDPETFQTMIKPAFTSFIGTYPEKDNDIMLSDETLKYLGIDHPKVGMIISADFYWNDLFRLQNTGEQTFTLTGYYNGLSDTSTAYMSRDAKKKSGFNDFPCTLLVEFTNPVLSKADSQNILSRLVSDKKVQVEYEESALYTSLVNLSGNVVLAFFSFIIICCVMVFFIRRMILATYKESVQFWGLMKVLGVTSKQIDSIIKKDEFKTCLWPYLLSELSAYLIMFVSNQISVYHDHVALFISDLKSDASICGFVFLIVLASVIIPTLTVRNKVNSIPPLASASYYGEFHEKAGKRCRTVKMLKFTGKNIPFQLSLIFLSKRKKVFITTVIILFLGCEMVLGSFTLAAGADYEKAFSSIPDFQVCVTQDACTNMRENLSESSKNQMLTAGMVHDLSEKLHDSIKDLRFVKGYFPTLDTDPDSVFGPEHLKNDTEFVIQPLEKKTLNQLCAWEKRMGRKINEHELLQHHGAVIISKNMLYSNSDSAIKSNMGRIFTVYDTLPYGSEADQFPSEQLSVCGYAEAGEKNFPNIPLAWDGENAVVIAVTPDTYNWLGSFIQEQILSVSFNVAGHSESSVKQRLSEWVRDENYYYEIEKGLSNIKLLECTSKTELIAENQNYITFSRITMNGVSILFFLVGLIVFLNTLLTEYVRDRQEHILLRYLGVTKKEMTKAFVMEGLIYFAALASLLITVGIYLDFAIGKLVQKGILYFEFVFPYHVFFVLLALLFMISFVLPLLIGRIQSAKYHAGGHNRRRSSPPWRFFAG
jgi:putative ABC transport system permease protein